MTNAILTTKQFEFIENLAMSAGKITAQTLMQRAGREVAEIVRDRYEKQPVLVLCGPGRNGCDGFYAAIELKKKRWDVVVACSIPKVKDMDDDLALAASGWTGEILPFDKVSFPEHGIIIDSVFGSGLNREITGDVQEVLFRLQRTSCDVVAVDVPSGLFADTGDCQPCTPRVNITVTFLRKKYGHVLVPGRQVCGEVVVADIGIPDDLLKQIPKVELSYENLPLKGDWREDASTKPYWSHKYHHGHVVVLGGKIQTGAASLSALSALRVGSGLVTIAAHPDTLTSYRAASPSLIIEPLTEMARFKDHYKDDRRNAILIGPGAGLDNPAALKKIVFDATKADPQRICVIDADALSVFEDDVKTFYKCLHKNCILTPHEGEFERIFPQLQQESKIERAMAAAKLTGAIIVLKGADTVIAAPDKPAIVNSTGTGWLATAGTGDVLAGMIAGLSSRHIFKPFDAVCAAVWMHGRAAEIFGPGLISEDLSATIPEVIKELAAMPAYQ